MNPIRILHVLGAMDRGGAETWLMNVLRNIDRTRFCMDFLVHTQEPGAFDSEIRALGSAVIPCLDPSRPWTYARRFRRILQHRAPYDVVHSHVHHYSGFVLRLAQRQGIPIRIAHSHNDTSSMDQASGIARRQYLNLSKRWIARYATHRLACSDNAGTALFGDGLHSQSPWLTLRCSIDLTPFQGQGDGHTMRSQLGILPETTVIGHVGRFMEQKNHGFLIDVVEELIARRPDACFLLIGDGPLRAGIEGTVRRRNLSHAVRFLGVRSDVAQLMMNAMDVLLLPSLYEGLPVVLIEAQAAGLPCVISDVVTPEADIVPPLMRRLSLSDPPGQWAEAIIAAHDFRFTVPRSQALVAVRRSPYNLGQAMPDLEHLYTPARLFAIV
jgi:glycosyltransferase involved in cell wall biosynthesis